MSGHQFLLRRLECALLGTDIRTGGARPRARTAALTAGCLLAAIAVAGCAFLALLRPQPALDRALIVMGQESGALYVRVGDTWHPVLNLASARLIAATNANPQQVRESDLSRTKRGALLGIPGAPQRVGPPLSGDESVWTMCDTDGVTTAVIGPAEGPSVRRLDAGQTLLVAPGSGAPAYLLYDGRRAVVDLADAAVRRALRLPGTVPRLVSQSLLNAIPEAPAIMAPRIRGAGGTAAGLPGFAVGTVLRITRGGSEDYYLVLSGGVQRIGPVVVDLLRFSDSQGSANILTVAPDVIRAASSVDTLPVHTFPDRAATPSDDPGTLCVTLAPGQPDAQFRVGHGLPVPAGQAPVTLAQADGHGPALDASYLPPGRSAYVRANTGTRYLITDSGVRFTIRDDDAAHDLGLPDAAIPAPWPMLAPLPAGPELSRQRASVARDVVAGPP